MLIYIYTFLIYTFEEKNDLLGILNRIVGFKNQNGEK